MQNYNRLRQKFMQADWQQRLTEQMGELARLFQLLRERRVNVAVVLCPQGDWEDNVPFEHAYKLMVTELCHADNVPLYDLSELVEDDDFADSSHLNLMGIEKFTHSLLNICIPFLKSTGALPAR